jgi:hypothetical protein
MGCCCTSNSRLQKAQSNIGRDSKANRTNQRRAEVSEWLDNFSFAGIKLTEGEKSLMRFAMTKERERIINLLEEYGWIDMQASELIGLIIGEQQ